MPADLSRTLQPLSDGFWVARRGAVVPGAGGRLKDSQIQSLCPKTS